MEKTFLFVADFAGYKKGDIIRESDASSIDGRFINTIMIPDRPNAVSYEKKSEK